MIKKIIYYIIYLYNYLYFKQRNIKLNGYSIIKKTSLDQFTRIEKNNYISNSEIGFASYIGQNSLFLKTKIGKFCSIGSNVRIIYGTHPSRNFVSTHPAFYSNAKHLTFSFVKSNIFDEEKYADTQRRFLLLIENDVWIGSNVSIMSGIKIGDGAIIGAGSLVTKDVAPYSIVGGNPAKLIRMRFSEDQINFLKKFSWFNKDLTWISNNAYFFKDIELLMAKFNNSNIDP